MEHDRQISSPEEIIGDARNGRMVILVDDEDRENEGDLIIPAQLATPDAINFMARFGRGLICLALTQERCDQLGLSLMTQANGTRHGTAFTQSIEARDGIDTGISAADRARTVAAAINSANGAEAIVTPGHVFPLIAQDGGVLMRAGHTEAAVDIARLAGLHPSGVICEVMRDDGEMARLDDLIAFGREHHLKIGTIRDLIAFRQRRDHLVERRATTTFTSQWGGQWEVTTFRNKVTGSEQVVLAKGVVAEDRPTLVRVHVLSPLHDLFGEEGTRADLLRRAMLAIDRHGSGIIVLLSSTEPDAISAAVALRSGQPGAPDIQRDYGTGASILSELGVTDMVLLTDTPHRLVGLSGYGLRVVGTRPVA